MLRRTTFLAAHSVKLFDNFAFVCPIAPKGTEAHNWGQHNHFPAKYGEERGNEASRQSKNQTTPMQFLARIQKAA